MKFSLALVMASLGVAASAQQPVPEIPYDSVPNFLKLPPNLYLGEVAGVAVNSKGHVFVFSRGNTTGPAYGAAAAQLLEFGPDGKYLREIGKNLYAWSFAHAVRVDAHDNIWAIDKGSDMIIKFDPGAGWRWYSDERRKPRTKMMVPGRTSSRRVPRLMASFGSQQT